MLRCIEIDHLRRFIGEVLVESYASNDAFKTFEKYVNVGFVHFSDLNKVGLNPKYNQDTPMGIYAYPITKSFIDDLHNDKAFFADNRTYAHIVVPKDSSKIIDINAVSIDDAVTFTNRIIDSSPLLIDMPYIDRRQFIKLTEYAEVKTIGGRLWYLTHRMSDELNVKRSSSTMFSWNKLFRRIGIDGVVDYEHSVIRLHEPPQAVFFTTLAIDHVDTVQNPKLSFYNDLIKDENDFNKQLYIAFSHAAASGAKTYQDFKRWFIQNEIEIHGRNVPWRAVNVAFDRRIADYPSAKAYIKTYPAKIRTIY
jgi:hypothetical protein